MKAGSVLAIASLAVSLALAGPRWPSPYDDLEEIMFQLHSFRARGFSDTISPCASEASGTGRQNAAEWLRTGFHDVATGNGVRGTGGIDGSLQFELGNGDNTGPAFNSTLQFFAPYFNSRTSLADLIAAGVYASVRSCGGPIIPIRPGRKDAAGAASSGLVPQPQNSAQTLVDQFARMGFSQSEMIQMTACGHTLGGVHEQNFPNIVPIGSTTNGRADFDGTSAAFDSKIATEYISRNTRNPLVIGPSVAANRHSDFKVFSRDNNTTIATMAGPTTFGEACRSALQRMIERVPSDVALADPITPYLVKPTNLQLRVDTGGVNLLWTGYVRVKTTDIAQDHIASVTIKYRNRTGGDNCGSACSFLTSVSGVGRGFDDSFAFYPVQRLIPVSVGISSFTVAVNLRNGTSLPFNNNGNSYPMQDAIMLQTPQSCHLASVGSITIMAAVRNDRADIAVNASISYKVPQISSPVPRLATLLVPLEKQECIGSYTLFGANTTIPGGLSAQAILDIASGDGVSAIVDGFKRVTDMGGTCEAFGAVPTCGAATNAPRAASTWTSMPTSSASDSLATTATATQSATLAS